MVRACCSRIKVIKEVEPKDFDEEKQEEAGSSDHYSGENDETNSDEENQEETGENDKTNSDDNDIELNELEQD